MKLPSRHGHFVLESGHHTDSWLDLDSVLRDPRKLQPRVAALTELLASHDVTAVCGPATGGAVVAREIARRRGWRSCSSERVSTEGESGLYAARYRVAAAARGWLAGEKIALVDDALSAGSAVRATLEDLQTLAADVTVVGAIWLLGDRGAHWLREKSIPLVWTERVELPQWLPSACPLCREGVPITPT